MSSKPRRLVLLVNPVAGRGRALRIVQPARAELERMGMQHRVVRTESAAHAAEEGRKAAEAGETVVAVGGDGFVGCLAGALRGSRSALAVIPAGRGNDFARMLRVPFAAARAARVAAEGRERTVDVGRIGPTTFLGIAGVGLDSEVQRIANPARVVNGKLVYLYATLRALVRWQHACFTVTVDGEAHELRGFSVAVANSRVYGGGMWLVPQAELDDGRLDVIMIGAQPKWRFSLSMPRVFWGGHTGDRSLRFVTGSSVEISADRPFTLFADGDPVAELPARVSIEPAALRVIVP